MMRDLYDFMRSGGFVIIAFVWVGFWLLLSVLVRRARGKYILLPTFADLQFSEKWTSGRSLATWWAKLGGANNCLFVGVGRDAIHIHPHFPFSLGFLPEIYGLDWEIPRSRVVHVERIKSFIGTSVRLEFSDGSATRQAIELRLRHPDEFLNSLRNNAPSAR